VIDHENSFFPHFSSSKATYSPTENNANFDAISSNIVPKYIYEPERRSGKINTVYHNRDADTAAFRQISSYYTVSHN